MKTCITASEPIEYGVHSILGAAIIEGQVKLVSQYNTFDVKEELACPSPALLAFIARAEAELLPKPKRGMETVTREDLERLTDLWGVAVIKNRVGESDRHAIITAWATERNIKLPEE